MNFLKKYYDKVILIALFLVFLGLLVFQVISILTEKNKRPEEKLNIVVPRADYVKLEIKKDYSSLESKLSGKMPEIDGSEHFFIPPRLGCCTLMVRNTNVHHFVPMKDLADQKCSFCGKSMADVGMDDAGGMIITGNDSDGDGIPDREEDRLGLDKNKKDDGALDKDEDGFTNTEEFRARTDINNPKSRPSYAKKLYVEKILRQPLGMRLIQYASSGEKIDVKQWEIQISVQIYDRRRRRYRKSTKYLHLGETLRLSKTVQYVMKSITPEFKVDEATGNKINVSKLIMVRKGENTEIPAVPGEEIVDPRQKVIFAFDVKFPHSNDISSYIGGSFVLGDETRGIDTFTVLSADVQNQTVRLFEKRTKRIYEIPSVKQRPAENALVAPPPQNGPGF